jgi:hypothetical protein
MNWLRPVGVLALLGAAVTAAAPAQTTSSVAALEEIQSLVIRADVLGGGVEAARLARLLEDVVRQELRRADILYEVSEPRQGDCCVLRLDVRLTTGSGRARFGTAFTARLELAFPDRVADFPTWTLLWTGRMLGNIVERQELTEALRFTARELAGDFVDRYRERFPVR